MLPHWSLDQTKLASTTSSNLGFGALVKSQKMMAHGWMTVSNCFPAFQAVTLLCLLVCQLKGCTGFVLKLNLNTGWRTKIAFIMRLNGSIESILLLQYASICITCTIMSLKQYFHIVGCILLCPDRDTLLSVSARYLWVQVFQWFSGSDEVSMTK